MPTRRSRPTASPSRTSRATSPTPLPADEGGPPPAPPTTGATPLPFETVALVLQGGGALGSYQAGVYQGLDEAGIRPNWLAGISIGALNTAVIAGNPPERRVQQLQAFWETICQPAFRWPGADALEAWIANAPPTARRVFSGFEAWRAVVEGQRAFFTPRGVAPWLGAMQSPGEASFYDTTPLKRTLERFVDFERLNAGEVRVSVGAVNVRTGNFAYFDNLHGPWRGKLRAEHFIASGALPPGFPAVEVDGEFYWDGGLVSNTPLTQVLQATPRRDTLAFQVDLWSAKGTLPQNVYEAQERQKDIQYSSRTRALTDMVGREQRYRRLLRDLLAQLPPDARDSAAAREAIDCASSRQTSVIHLVYQDKEWEGLAKDYEFSTQTLREHWASGLADIRSTLEHRQWLALPPDGVEFVTHDRHRRT